MTSHTLIVDERDSRVDYDGKWTPAGSSADYKRTSFGTNETNAAMTFQFNGTSIALVGDLEPGGTCTGTFTLDSQSSSFSSQSVSQETFQQTLFSKDGLSPGVHTFNFKLSSCQTTNQSQPGPYVFFDYMLYSATDPSLDGATFYVDDRDSSLKYSGSWQKDSRTGAFDGTVSGGGSGATLDYTFSGVGITVYASLTTGTGNVKASFSLDGQDQSGYSSGPQNASNVQIMTSKSLSAGSHTLKITSQGEAPLWIDYLLVQPGTSTAAATTPAKETNFGAIIGGAVGGAVLLIGALIIFWMMMKKRRVLKPRHRLSNATSTNYLWKQNGTMGTGADGLSYAASTGAWSQKVASIRSGTTSGIGSRRNSRASQPPNVPSTRPVLYSPLEDRSPGLQLTPQLDGNNRDLSYDSEGASLAASADGMPVTSYPPTPPYNAVAFDRSGSHSRPTTPGARSGLSYEATSPSHTVTTFDPSVLDHDFSGRAQLARSPSYRTTAPETHMVTAVSPPMPAMPMLPEDPYRDRRQSLTPSYITTAPAGATLEISDFLPPRVAHARQEALAAATPPSSFNPGPSGRYNRHERTPSYHTTASASGSSISVPPVPAIPTISREPSAASSAASSSKQPNVFHSTSPSRGSSRHSSRTRPSGSRANPRAGQPLPRPPSPSSQSQTSTIHGAPSIMTVASMARSVAPSVAPTVASAATGMTSAESKHFEATGERPARFQDAPEGSSQQDPSSQSDPSPGEPPPQYQYRF